MKVRELLKMLEDSPQEMEVLVEYIAIPLEKKGLNRKIDTVIIDLGRGAVYLRQQNG